MRPAPRRKAPPRSPAIRRAVRFPSSSKSSPWFSTSPRARPTPAGKEGCNEWIAADGYIDLGAAQRLKNFLNRNPGRNLPIYFASPGGLLADALAIGRLLHARGMTAGVAATVPLGCIPLKEKDDACRALKRSGSELAAELRSLSASCNSA